MFWVCGLSRILLKTEQTSTLCFVFNTLLNTKQVSAYMYRGLFSLNFLKI